jgi:hypothetical protein
MENTQEQKIQQLEARIAAQEMALMSMTQKLNIVINGMQQDILGAIAGHLVSKDWYIEQNGQDAWDTAMETTIGTIREQIENETQKAQQEVADVGVPETVEPQPEETLADEAAEIEVA